MKHFIIAVIALTSYLSPLTSDAQVRDAFQGILPVTDPAMMRSLNGEWSLKVVEGISNDTTVPALDETWGKIPVPGCWEQYGFSQPSYDKALPLTGYYRTSFNLPREWKGKRIVLRLDGVLYGYDLFVNGKATGSWRSGYNTALFDITDHLKAGTPNQLAMRVITQFPGSDFDYNDDWAPCGIFRDVTLMAVPETHLSDLTITTKNSGEVNVETKVAGEGATVTHEILDAQGKVVGTTDGTPKAKSLKREPSMAESQRLAVVAPHLWTAETPYLYTLRTTLTKKGKTLQRFEHKFGFRELAIDGAVLKLNGRPIKLRGVTCHSTDPQTVKVVSDDLTLRDMRLMKEASVNYIRTSHYPREPRFYELADSLGFYVIDEVPFGFGDKNLQKEEFYPVLQQRAQATIRRDKNHPSVLIWSLGNENPLTDICIRLGDYVKTELDASRPYCYPQVGSYFRKLMQQSNPSPRPSGKVSDSQAQPGRPALGTLSHAKNEAGGGFAPIYAPHYPTTDQIAGFYQQLDRPVIFTEYCHTLGTSFEDHDRQWEIIQRTPGIAGGSVWEWVDQGMPFGSEKQALCSLATAETQEVISEKPQEKGERYGYEEKVYTSDDGGFEMYGNKGTDGLLYADRTPLPNYYELQHNYARAFISAVQCPDLKSKTSDIKSKTSNVKSKTSNFKRQTSNVTVLCHNRYDFLNLKDNVTFSWALTNCRDTIARGAFSPDCAPGDSTDYTLCLPAEPAGLALLHFAISDAQGHTFLRQSFVLSKPQISWAGNADANLMIEQGPLVRAGRKPTLAESVTQKGRLPKKYLLRADNRQVRADIRRQPVEAGGEQISFTLTPDSADLFRAELGLAFLLDAHIDRVQWMGQGPFASYPGRHQANRYGLWAKQQGDLYFEGNHGGIDAVLLTDSLGNGLLVVGDSLDINFEQTDRGIVLTVNAAVAGQGPKFRRTAFPATPRPTDTVSATFRIYPISAGRWPAALQQFFLPAATVPAPFRPFVTQYDTYLMRLADIAE